ncbi:SDR family NAD(P)-dependent oxidoreductase [Streptomyces anandii]|uniref:SDR family NAD(P)-dependent oxidoreductase n=1 Tax=Streptomyces anandii TaxID=285454 RepID=A0ABW6HDV3_9ACTN
MDLGLAGKTAFITGGSGGIGLAIGRALREEGAEVTVCGRDPERLRGSGLPGVRADVTDPEALARAVDEAAERMGGLDLLVANAGGASGGGLLDSTPEDWLRTYELNVLHAAHAIRCAVPHFARRGGGDHHPEQYEAFARDDFPRGRLVEPREVADVACFLLSPRAGGINGANICVDGAQDHPSAGRFFPRNV